MCPLVVEDDLETTCAHDRTRITLENLGAIYSVEIPGWELTAKSIVEDLLKPLLRAAGFADGTVSDIFGEE